MLISCFIREHVKGIFSASVAEFDRQLCRKAWNFVKMFVVHGYQKSFFFGRRVLLVGLCIYMCNETTQNVKMKNAHMSLFGGLNSLSYTYKSASIKMCSIQPSNCSFYLYVHKGKKTYVKYFLVTFSNFHFLFFCYHLKHSINKKNIMQAHCTRLSCFS